MPSKEKLLALLSAALSIVFFYLSVGPIVSSVRSFWESDITFSMILGIVTAFASLICIYISIKLLETKISRETYFFVLFVFSFSASGFILAEFVLSITLPVEWLVTAAVLLGTPLSSVFAGYSSREIREKIARLGLDHGITLLTVFILVSLSVADTLPYVVIHTSGTIAYPALRFENGDDMAMVQGQVSLSGLTFTASVPIRSDNIFVADQVLNITNRLNDTIGLRINVERVNVNLSEVGQFRIFFTLENGTQISLLNITDDSIMHQASSLNVESLTTVVMGLDSLARAPYSGFLGLSSQVTGDEHNVTIVFSLDSGQ